MTPSGLMNIREAADYIGVSDQTIRRYITLGLIAPTNIGTGRILPRWAIGIKELDAFIERRTQKPIYAQEAYLMLKSERKRKSLRDYNLRIPPQGFAPDGLPNNRRPDTPKPRKNYIPSWKKEDQSK